MESEDYIETNTTIVTTKEVILILTEEQKYAIYGDPPYPKTEGA